MKNRILRRLGLVPVERVHQLVQAQFEERLRVAAEAWADGFEAGAKSRCEYEEAA